MCPKFFADWLKLNNLRAAWEPTDDEEDRNFLVDIIAPSGLVLFWVTYAHGERGERVIISHGRHGGSRIARTVDDLAGLV